MRKRFELHLPRLPRMRRRSMPGAPPGTLIADPTAPKPVMRAVAYGPGELVERNLERIEDAADLLERFPVTWINVDGLGDASTIRAIGAFFKLHPLALEDVLNTHQRPKAEPFADHLFIVMREMALRERVENEQICVFLGKNYVLSFQERAGDCFDPVRHRIRDGASLFRGFSADYMAYALIDATVDSYFPIVERLGDELEEIEQCILAKPSPHEVARLHEIKRDLYAVRRAAWPFRDALGAMLRDHSVLIQAETRTFLRDCVDHAVQIIDLVETDREVCSDLMDVYLSNVSNRMNQVMKLLTIISTIFIPLTFLAGVYGMNFDTGIGNMPELLWRHGYLIFWMLCIGITGGLLVLFWRLGWFGGGKG